MKTVLALALLLLGVSAAPAAAQVKQTTYQLFGPVQHHGALKQVHGARWAFPGTALTASTKTFWFNYGFPRAVFARLVVVWRPYWNHIRLVHAADGPSDIQQIGQQINGNGYRNPRVDGLDITAEWNALADAGQYRHIGFQVWNAGGVPEIYEVRIEVVYEH